MQSVPVAEARDRFSSLIEAAEGGQRIEITSRGRSVAVLGPPSTAACIANRLRQILGLMREAKTGVTLPRLAEAAGRPLGSLDGIFDGDVEPSPEEIRGLANRFFWNAEWLKHGDGTPFTPIRGGLGSLDYEAVLNCKINEKSPDEVIFFMEDPHEWRKPGREFYGKAGVILCWDKYTYALCTSYAHISTQNGSYSSLRSYIRLAQKVSERFVGIRGSGFLVTEEHFNGLMSGMVWPGNIKSWGRYSPFWDDLWDYQHRFPIADKYEELHGRAFVQAQEALRILDRLEETEHRMTLNDFSLNENSSVGEEAKAAPGDAEGEPSCVPYRYSDERLWNILKGNEKGTIFLGTTGSGKTYSLLKLMEHVPQTDALLVAREITPANAGAIAAHLRAGGRCFAALQSLAGESVEKTIGRFAGWAAITIAEARSLFPVVLMRLSNDLDEVHLVDSKLGITGV